MFKSLRSQKVKDNKEDIFKSSIIDINENKKFDMYQSNFQERNTSYSKGKTNIENDSQTYNDSSDDDQLTLDEIEKYNKKKKREKENFLNNKRNNNKYNGIIVYNQKKKKLENIFSASLVELNNFLFNCQVKEMPYKESVSSHSNNNNNVIFDPNEWMKSNNINQRTLSLEDLSIYCSNKIKENSNNFNVKKENMNEVIKKEFENEENINFIKIEKKFIDNKLNDNYNQLKQIILSKNLIKEQKNWLNNFIQEIQKMDINKIEIQKDKEGKDIKLEIVFDLDNTCIFSFLSSEDNLFIQNKKDIFPKKGVKMISFNFNRNVIYTVLIVRKGLKEFIKYVEPICNFHISTLGYENYGTEIKDILSEFSEIKFIRYKSRLNCNEFSKKIDDLYLDKERTIIFDDNVNIWENQDNEYVINSKIFFDEECAVLNLKEKIEENENFKYNKNLFLKSYRLFYNKMNSENDEDIDWKNQIIEECDNVPFYQYKQGKDYSYNNCYSAEYLNSSKLQFIYMQNVIKEIYYLKFIYGLDIPLSIKLIRISTLANMKFYLKYLDYIQIEILSSIIKVCGGIIYDGENRESNEKIYLVSSKRTGFKYKRKEIEKVLIENPFFVLINEKFILDTYYFMTNLKNNINDSEYSFKENLLI